MVEWDHGFTSSSPEYQQLVGDDIEDFRSEKILKTEKSPEEIQKLTVDENLSEMDRACLLISTGQDVQKLCVINHLPQLLKIDQMDTLCRVVPKLCGLLPAASQELQEAASKIFAIIIQQDLIPIHIYVSACLPTVLKQLESRDCAISALWLETTLVAIPHLPKEVIKRQILRIAEANGQLSMSASSRQGTCRIIGAIANKFDSYWVKKELFPLAKSLCLDVNSGVRVVMCQQLNGLVRALGLDLAKSTIFSQLIELTNDEEACVRVEAIEALTDLSSFLDKVTLKNEVIPLLKRFCEWSVTSGAEETVTSTARLLGRICYELKDALTPEQRLWFLDFYRKLTCYSCPVKRFTSAAQPPSPSTFLLSLHEPSPEEGVETECRQLCAYNFPAMVLFCGKGSFEKELLPTLKELTEDSHWSVRRTIACGFHELVKTLGSSGRLKVAVIYQNLLKDTSGEVLCGLVAHLPDTLDTFAQAFNLSPETRQPGLLEFISPLLLCEQLASSLRQWRLHQQLLSSIECLVGCMTSEQLYSKFVPVLFKYINCTGGNCVLPVKLAACKTLCIFIRHIRKLELRQELCTKLKEDCSRSPSYKQRLLFIDVCGFVLDIFSRCFFKENFFQSLLELANDPIVNVRLRLCRLLPPLKSILKLPGDRVLLQKLEQTVRKLISQERDPDASQAIRDAVTEMDRIEVAMETLTRRTFFEADLTDQRREEEEKALLLSEAKECEKQSAKKVSNKTSKPGFSPREHRKGSSSSLSGMLGGNSPSPGSKSGGRSRNVAASSPSVTKSLSAPSSSSADQTGLNNSAPSSINQTNLLVSRRGNALANSPHTSPSAAHKPKGSPTSKGSQATVASTASKVSVTKSKDTVGGNKTTQQRKKVQYGLEYSKSKKRT